MKQDTDATKPFIVEEELRFARGTRHTLKYPVPGLLSGDWLVSPSGVEGYLAGRSLDDPSLWVFVMKTGPSGWDQQIVEMREEAFVGFRLKEKHASR